MKTRACILFLACLLPAAATADDISAVLDTSDGSSGFVVCDAETTEVMRVSSDGDVTAAAYAGDGSGLTNVTAAAYTETDPIWTAERPGYATGTPVYAETDPLFGGSVAADISAGDTQQWHEAYGWGDHALGGYAGAADLATASNSLQSQVSDLATAKVSKAGDTMTGPLTISVAGDDLIIDSGGDDIMIGQAANGSGGGAAVGCLANAYAWGAALGGNSTGILSGVAVGKSADGAFLGTAVGSGANGANTNIAIGRLANARGGVERIAIGHAISNTNDNSIAVRGDLYLDGGSSIRYRPGFGAGGWTDYRSGLATGAPVYVETDPVWLSQKSGYATGTPVYAETDPVFGGTVAADISAGDTQQWHEAYGWGDHAAAGYITATAASNSFVDAAGDTMTGPLTITDGGSHLTINSAGENVRIGNAANAGSFGAALGYHANAYSFAVAVGPEATGAPSGVAVGYQANGANSGTAVGRVAAGAGTGVAVGYGANGSFSGVALGSTANGVNTNIAIGSQANARGGTRRIAIGYKVTNSNDNSIAVRGDLYLDGGTGVMYRSTFGSGGWSVKAFSIDHPLDPENKMLRHYCMEGPEVWNVYAGNATLADGQAVVQLPDYYSALNLAGAEVCSLTPWGRAMVWIEEGVQSNAFVIGGDRDVKVSWTIKVPRNDPACIEDLKNRPVEQLKSEVSELQRREEMASANTGTGP